MTTELICINCPLGCRMSVTIRDKQPPLVEGNACGRGAAYALQEAVRPMRVLTANMKAKGCARPFSVRSSAAVPRERLLDCAAALKRCHPSLPIHIGDVVLTDFLGLGVDIVATQNLDFSPNL